MKVKIIFRWFDLWVGLFIDAKKKTLYVFPLPMLGLMVQFGHPSTTKEKILYQHGVSINQDGNDYMKTLNKIKLDKEYAHEQCQKRDDIIKAQDRLLEVRRQKCEILVDNKNSDVFKMIGLVKLDDELTEKIEQLKNELQ